MAVSASTPVTFEDDDADDICGAYANTAPDHRAKSGAYANAALPSSLDQSTPQFYANVAPDGLQPTAPALAGTATPRIDDHARGCWRRLLIWITTHSYVTELRFASGEVLHFKASRKCLKCHEIANVCNVDMPVCALCAAMAREAKVRSTLCSPLCNAGQHSNDHELPSIASVCGGRHSHTRSLWCVRRRV